MEAGWVVSGEVSVRPKQQDERFVGCHEWGDGRCSTALGRGLNKRDRSSARMGSQAVNQLLPKMMSEEMPWRTVKGKRPGGGLSDKHCKSAMVMEASRVGNEGGYPFCNLKYGSQR